MLAALKVPTEESPHGNAVWLVTLGKRRVRVVTIWVAGWLSGNQDSHSVRQIPMRKMMYVPRDREKVFRQGMFGVYLAVEVNHDQQRVNLVALDGRPELLEDVPFADLEPLDSYRELEAG